MKFIFAGFSFALPRSHEARSGKWKIKELLSFWDFVKMGPGRVKEVIEMPYRSELFLDSGAYSAWKKGIAIDIDEYADFVLGLPADTFSVVTNLDVIPGAWGEIPSQKDIDESAARGWENYWHLAKRLKPMGIKPLHVFHQGEDVKWLKKLMDEAEYFGVSPGNDRTTEQKMVWLDEIMPILTDQKGRPLQKWHGFGVTSLDLLFRYPFFSCDSTSWVLTGRYGSCFIPLNGGVHKICFSDKSPSLREAGKHYKTYSKIEQQAIAKYVESQGLTPTQLAEEYQKRDEMNIIFFLELERNWKDQPFRRNDAQPGIF